MKIIKQKRYIECAFSEKEQAKALGARWDDIARRWYIPDGVDLKKFERWLPKDNTQTSNPLISAAQECAGSSGKANPTKIQLPEPTNVQEKVIRYWLHALQCNNLNQLLNAELLFPIHDIQLLMRGNAAPFIDSRKRDDLIEKYGNASEMLNDTLNPREDQSYLLVDIKILVGFFYKSKHGKHRGDVLMAIPAKLSKEGQLLPPDADVPQFNHQYLESVQCTQDLIIGNADVLEAFQINNPMPTEGNWAIYAEYVHHLFSSVTQIPMTEFCHPNRPKVKLSYVLIPSESNDSMTLHIRTLLQALARCDKINVPLFERLFENIDPEETLQRKEQWHIATPHMGHMDETKGTEREVFPLDPSQREALVHFLQIKPGMLQAVNGPPGTGKTNMLRAVIASTWVHAVIQDNPPIAPIVIACAATNQAVTNIISSFDSIAQKTGTPSIQSRWISQVGSYGWFFPASSQFNKPKWQTYQLLSRVQLDLIWHFGGTAATLENIGSNDLLKMEDLYVQTFNQIFPLVKRNNITQATEHLRQCLLKIWKTIVPDVRVHFEKALQILQEHPCQTLANAENRVKQIKDQWVSSDSKLTDSIKEQEVLLKKTMHLTQDLVRLKDWLNHCKNPSWKIRWFPFLYWHKKHKRKALLIEKMQEILDTPFSSDTIDIDFCFDKIVSQLRELQANHAPIENHLKKLKNCHTNLHARYKKHLSKQENFVIIYTPVSDFLRKMHNIQQEYGGSEKTAALLQQLEDHFQTLYRMSNESPQVIYAMEKFEAFLDMTLRSRSFHLAARYWEGAWLIAKNASLQANAKPPTLIDSIRLHCMLAPCIVSTFYSLPRLFRRVAGDFEWQEADLLIVDEAGQALPEIAAAAFALTKSAIVVGDIEQLKPIWSFTQKEDEFFLAKMGLSEEQHYLRRSGHRVGGGSMMQIARHCTQFSQPGQHGVQLTRHYRCVPTIIDFCNELVYRNALIPFREEEVHRLFHPMCYVHTHFPPSQYMGSWINPGEAQEIAQWLVENRHSIENFYSTEVKKKTIADLVAIVTPYNKQIEILKKAMASALNEPYSEHFHNDENIESTLLPPLHTQMVIGTVHALQGAEKPIVLFSSVVEACQGKTLFMDRDPDMLNVTVSRAKDCFIVFGHPELYFSAEQLSIQNNSPSAILGRYLNRYGKRLYPRHLVIVESPGKARVIAKILGREYTVMATQGHFRDLLMSEHALDVEAGFLPKWRLDPEKQYIIDNIASALNNMETLILGTDDDREGEAIAWHLLEALRDKIPLDAISIRRMRFSTLDEDSIREAVMQSTVGLNYQRVQAALVRRIVDYLMGKQVSAELNAHRQQQGHPDLHLSIGRVQAGMLSLIANNETEEQDDKAMPPRWAVTVEVYIQEQATAIFHVKEHMGKHAKPKLFESQQDAEAFAATLENRPLSEWTPLRTYYNSTCINVGSAPALTTLEILKIAYSGYGLMPGETMQVLQELYEGPAEEEGGNL